METHQLPLDHYKYEWTMDLWFEENNRLRSIYIILMLHIERINKQR